ncbi:hemolysin-III related [mine drainage metagenome]|uniref:Hemolysin-III related n=1 Tax=mine drainage metagenome TaxID=410659 RepID=A0A1J5S811_9ZZZZ
MSIPSPSAKREQSRSEEIANSSIHGIGFIAALVGTPVLIEHALRYGELGYIVGTSVFAASMILLYLASTLYHALQRPGLKGFFHQIDHLMIYLLIAGTYTPFTLGVLHGAWGWTLFGIIWGLATIGMILRILKRMGHPVISTGMYLLMGWLMLVAAEPMYEKVSTQGLLWLLTGAASYTAGVYFYATDGRVRYGHSIWHLFVLGGTVSHYLAVWYAV